MSQNATQIRAQVWTGGLNFEQREIAAPQLASGESLIRLRAATMCGSDFHTVLGRRQQPCPSILGHEGVGMVEETRNPALRVGQRVTFSVTAPCGRCRRCRTGMTAKCLSVLKTGHEAFDSIWPLSGTYATHVVLRENQPVIAVPDELGDAPASIASCAGATVAAASEAAGGIENLQGARVLVVGVGMLGLVAVDEAIRAGAQVVAMEPNAERRELATALGATAVPGEESLEQESFDVCLELSGTQAGVGTCMQRLDIGARAVLVGSVATSPAVDLDPEWIVRGWRTVTGVHNYEPRHLER
ncbi:alcohol dehydrogenase catalytic domain-containing protein [Corynebacterium sp.]|uniref:alcohol dehydrogenase catalytic domain-containing protein n=1 Tax=Corynebacterium sp. TaxID=1720 RepID=UPI0034C66C0A